MLKLFGADTMEYLTTKSTNGAEIPLYKTVPKVNCFMLFVEKNRLAPPVGCVPLCEDALARRSGYAALGVPWLSSTFCGLSYAR